MHPDLPKLLDLQAKDQRLASIAARLVDLAAERAALDAALDGARAQLASATRGADEAARRRDAAEQKLETQRSNQERRRTRLEQERNPRVAAQLMADVELARSILAQEESEWMRLAEEATGRQRVVGEAEAHLAALEAEQAELRGDIAAREAAVQGEHDAAHAEREAAAAQLDRPLRIRYDRLKSGRLKEVMVPATNATCTACFTQIPRSRVGQLAADSVLLEGCEMCGAILYLVEATA